MITVFVTPMGTKLHDRIAELLPDTARVPRVLDAAGIPAHRVAVTGAASVVWFNVVEEACRRGGFGLPNLVRAVEKEVGRELPALHAAADAMRGEARTVEKWMCELDRVAWKKALGRLERPVTAAVLMGDPRAGHRYLPEWLRFLRNDRRRALVLGWPRWVKGEHNRLQQLLRELVDALGDEALRRALHDPAAPFVKEPDLAAAAWAPFLVRLQATLRETLFPGDLQGARTLALVRHEVREPDVSDPAVLAAWIRHVWAPLAEGLGALPGHALRCVVTFEFDTGAARAGAALRKALQGLAKSDHLALCALDALPRIEPDDIQVWLVTWGDTLLPRLERTAPSLLADGTDPDVVAHRVHARTGGNYDEIIDLFRE